MKGCLASCGLVPFSFLLYNLFVSLRSPSKGFLPRPLSSTKSYEISITCASPFGQILIRSQRLSKVIFVDKFFTTHQNCCLLRLSIFCKQIYLTPFRTGIDLWGLWGPSLAPWFISLSEQVCHTDDLDEVGVWPSNSNLVISFPDLKKTSVDSNQSRLAGHI